MPTPLVSIQEVEQLLRKEWGDFSTLEPLADGLTAQAFSFRSGEADYVIRIGKSFYSFQKDAFVSSRFASASLPIPEVFKLGRLDAETYFCISRRASGVRLQDLTTLELANITGAVSDVMSAISKTDIAGTRGFGRFGAQGRAPYETWKAFLLAVADSQHFDWTKAADQVDRNVINEATSTVKELAPLCPEQRCLLHGDFGSYNVLSDGEKITGVIDWDLGLFGDPLYEVANLLFWQEERLLPLLEKLQGDSEHLPRWRERVLCYQLHIGLNEIYYERYDIPWLVDRCKEIMS